MNYNFRDVMSEIKDFYETHKEVPTSLVLNETTYKTLPKVIQESMFIIFNDKKIKITVCKDCN